MKDQRNPDNALFGLLFFFLDLTSVEQHGDVSELLLIHYGINLAQKKETPQALVVIPFLVLVLFCTALTP